MVLEGFPAFEVGDVEAVLLPEGHHQGVVPEVEVDAEELLAESLLECVQVHMKLSLTGILDGTLELHQTVLEGRVGAFGVEVGGHAVDEALHQFLDAQVSHGHLGLMQTLPYPDIVHDFGLFLFEYVDFFL